MEKEKKFDAKNWLMCNIFRLIRLVFMISSLAVYARFWMELHSKVTLTLFDLLFVLVLVVMLIVTLTRLYTKRGEVYIGFSGFEIFGKSLISLVVLGIYLTPTILLLLPRSF